MGTLLQAPSCTMGLGRRTMGIGGTMNPNLKDDCGVKQFCTNAGLDVSGFPEYLSSLVSQGHELGALSNADWEQILGPMELPRERALRVHKAISGDAAACLRPVEAAAAPPRPAPGHGYSQAEVSTMYADARLRSSPFATGY